MYLLDVEVSLAVHAEQIDGKNLLIRKLRIGIVTESLAVETQKTYGHHRYTYTNLLVLTFSPWES